MFDSSHVLSVAEHSMLLTLWLAMQTGVCVGFEGALPDFHQNQYGRPLPVLQEHMGPGSLGPAASLLAMVEVLEA